jgi:hypothetical protein
VCEPPVAVPEEGELAKESGLPTKAVKAGAPELLEKLELPTEEPAGKIEEPEEKEGFLSKEGEKPLLPGDRKVLLDTYLLNGAAPPPPAIYLGSEGNGPRLIAHRVTVAHIISYCSHPLRLCSESCYRHSHRAE